MTLNKKHCLTFLTIFIILLIGATTVSATTDTNKTQENIDNKQISTPHNYDVDKMVQTRVTKTDSVADEQKTITTEKTDNNTKTINKKDTTTRTIKEETQPITVTQYSELKTALTSTTYDDITITLEEDLTSDGAITINNAIKNIIIDGNHKTINGNSKQFLIANNIVNLTIKNVTITNCASNNGPVISSTANSNITIRDSNITNNRATYYNSGTVIPPSYGVLYITNGNVVLEGNNFEDNRVSSRTGSYILLLPQTSKIVNNTFINNLNTLNSESLKYDIVLARSVNEIHDNVYTGNYLHVMLDFRELDLNLHDQTEIYDDVEFNLYVVLNDIYNSTVTNGTIFVDTADENSYIVPVVDGFAKIELSYEYIQQQVDDGYSSWKTVWYTYEPLEDHSYEPNVSNSTEFIPESIRNPTLTASVTPSSGRVGETFTIKGTLKASGNVMPANKVTLTIGDDYVVTGHTDGNGEVYFNYTPDNLGIYTATLTVAAHGGIRNAQTKSVNFIVEGDPSYISVYTNETEVTGAKPVKIYGVLTNMSHEPIGGATVNLTFKNQYKASTTTDPETGEYSFDYITDVADTTTDNIKVIYGGNASKGINATSNTTTLKVNPYETNITFTASDTQYGGQTNVTGYVYDVLTGDVIQTGQVSITITNGGTNTPADIIEGKFEYLRSMTSLGQKTATVTFQANGLYAGSVNTTTFTVTKGITNATINTNGPIKVGGTVTVSGMLANDLGNHIGSRVYLNVTMGNQTNNPRTTNAGTYTTTFTLNEAKDYDIIVAWEGNTNYLAFKNTTVFSVYKIPTITNVSVVNDLKDNVTIDVSVRENDTYFKDNITSGNINVTVGENSKLYPITGKTTRITLDDEVNITTTDTVDFKVEFVESDVDLNSTGINNTTGEVITQFTARPVSSRITVQVSPLVQNITRNVTISGEVFDEFDNIVEEGNVTIDIPDTTPILVPFTGGKYEYNFTTLTAGNNSFNVTFNASKTESGSILIQESKNSSSFMVDKLPTITNVITLNNSYNNVTIRINVTSTINTEKFVSKGLVYVYDFIHSQLLEQEVDVGEKSVDLVLPLEPGTNKLLVYYQENNIYLESNARNESAFTFDQDVYVINVEKIPSITNIVEIVSNKSGEVALKINVTNTTEDIIQTGHVLVLNSTSGEILGEGDLEEGIVIITLEDVTEPGIIEVNVTYEGNDYYLPSNATGYNKEAGDNVTIITVTVDPSISIALNTSKSIIRESVHINGTVLNKTGQKVTSGSVNVTINGNDYPATLTDGVYSYDFTPETNGTYTITASYINDDTIIVTSQPVELLVNKINSTTSYTVLNNTAGNVTLNISVAGVDGNKSMTGSINFTINGNKIPSPPLTGEESYIVKFFEIDRSGLISVVVTFNENENYYSSTADTTQIEVVYDILELNVSVEEDPVEIGSIAVIKGTLGNDLNMVDDAYIDIYVNDVLVGTAKTLEDGQFELEYTTDTIGENSVYAVYNGDNYRYQGAHNETIFNVIGKSNYNISVSAKNITYGQEETIKVTLPSDAKGIVTINITGRDPETINLEEGNTLVIPAYELNVGEYEINISYTDTNHALKTNNTKFKVEKTDSIITINIVDNTLKINDNVVIYGIVTDSNGKVIPTGTVKVNIKGTIYNTTVTDGEYKLENITSTVGTFPVTATFNGNTNINNQTSQSREYTVTKLDTTITVNVTTPIKVGNTITITGLLVDENNKPISGAKVEIKVGNKAVANVTTQNDGSYKTTFSDTIVGTHNVEAKYAGDTNYNGDNVTTTITVETLGTKVSINDITNVPVGENVEITGKLVDENNKAISSATVKVSFDGKTTSVTTDKDGNYKATYPTSNVGDKDVRAEFVANNNYEGSTQESTAKVVKNNATITLTLPANAKVGDPATVKGKVTDKNGKVVANMPVNVTVNGKTTRTVTDNNGNFEIEAVAVEGNNPVTASANNDNYNVKDATGKFTATRKDAKLTLDPIKDTKLKDNVTVTGKLVDEQNKPISYAPINVTVNGKTTTVTTDANGKYTLPVTNVAEGTNNVSVKYEDTQYKAQTQKATFKATTSKTIVTVPNIVGVIGEDITLIAYVKDQDGNPVTGGNLVFKLNGRTLRTDGRFDTNNTSPLKLSVKDGIVTYTIKADLYLRNGKNITASYSGSSKYEAAKANVATANIKKRNAQVVVSITPSTSRQNTDVVFTATLTDKTPNAKNKTSLTTDANIIFKVNGVTIKDKTGKANRIPVTHSVINYVYHVPTGMGGVDEKGVKNYTVEAVYDNPVFYPDTRNSSVLNVIRSEVNINFIKTSIKGNVLSVKANLTDFENKYVVGNSNVCIKINGVTYKENGETKYFTVKNGRVDLSGIKIASGTKVKEVMLVTGAREGYLGARSTTTDITT